MDYYEKNKVALEKKYPMILEYLEKNASEKAWDVQLLEARDGNHAVAVTKEKKTYRLNSSYRPLNEAKKWAGQFALQNIGVNIFMFGFGNGYFARELLNQAAKDARIFLWEPDASVFSVILEQESIEDIFEDDRFRFYLGAEGFQRFKNEIGSVMNWVNISTQIECIHIRYQELYPEEYENFLELVLQTKSTVGLKRDTNAWFAHSAVDNILRNLKFIRHSNFITEFIGKIDADIPAIIVAAGPSLEKNIELLREADGKALIIATDTAVRFLDKRGLPYDCIVTVDPGKSAKYITDYPGCKDKVLFCEAQSRPEILEFHTGRKVWSYNSFYIVSLYAAFGLPFPDYPTGGSVATSGLILAWMIGLKNIILIGQDLAYDGDRTHADGHENHIRNEELSIEYVEGVNGTKVKTRHDWQFYRKWIEDFIAGHEDVTVTDATEGGALIHGSEVLTFKEAIDKYCEGREFSFENFMENFPETFEVLDFQPFYDKIMKLQRDVPAVRKKAEEAKKLAKEYLSAGRKLSAKRHDRIIKELKKANAFISRQEGYELIETYTSDLALGELKNINQVTGDAYVDDRASVEIALEVYESFIQAVDSLEPKVESALQQL